MWFAQTVPTSVPATAWGVLITIALIVVTAAAKWWSDRKDVFDRAMVLMDQQQEDITALRSELAVVRGELESTRRELGVVRDELIAVIDDRTALRHELDQCERRHSVLAAVMRREGIEVPEEAG